MQETKNIYLMGICGTGVGALAGLLKSLGHHVRGSDEHVYPPMSDKLAEWGIEVLQGYDAAHLDPAPDLVIVGNVIRKSNVEATAARERQLPTMSMPQALAEYGIADRHSIVVAGTHGKTTTTALAAHVLQAIGKQPSFLVGGALVGYAESFQVGEGAEFVVEGDEYDTAYFDKGPKFNHYRPRTAIITSLEFDHADIYDDVQAIERSFMGLIERVPQDGHLVVWAGAERACRLVKESGYKGRVTLYDPAEATGTDLFMRHYTSGPAGLTFEAVLDGVSLGEMTVPMWGDASAQNVLAVIAALSGVGVSSEQLAVGLKSFAGVRRRMEVRGEPGGITLVDDFAHHPTAVHLTLNAARTRWPGRRLWAIFEPRSATSRRNVFHEEYVQAFRQADQVVIGSHGRLAEVPESERFDGARLAEDIEKAGGSAVAVSSVQDVVDQVQRRGERDDVLMIMSNGDFGGLHKSLLDALGEA